MHGSHQAAISSHEHHYYLDFGILPVQREVLLYHLITSLFFAFLGDIEDMAEQVYTVVVELKVESSLLLGM